MLNLNGSLTKAGVKYSTLWADDFADAAFGKRLAEWLRARPRRAPRSTTCIPFRDAKIGAAERDLGRALADELRRDKAIMGVFDEGCMGMFNAIIPDHLLNPTGVFKERLSQSALYYETTQTSDDEARAVRQWMEDRGAKFLTGPKHEEDLTDEQILLQCKMYIAALRIADDFGCDCVGIQYQQGLKDLLPASDLVEGTLNDSVRPPVKSRDGKRELYAGEPLPHFNEVDECAGLDGLFTYRVHRAMGQPVENTLHDLRWGDADKQRHDRRLRVGVRNLRQRPAVAPHRRLERRHQRTPARDVLPQRRRHDQGHLQARRGRVVARVHRRRPAEDGPRPRRGDRAAARRNRAPLERHDAAVADHARGDLRRVARPDDGPPQGNHIQVGLRQQRRGSRRRLPRQSGHGRGARPRSGPLRHAQGRRDVVVPRELPHDFR